VSAFNETRVDPGYFFSLIILLKARLVAVSKLKPASDILATYEKAGQRNFGENYVRRRN